MSENERKKDEACKALRNSKLQQSISCIRLRLLFIYGQ